MQNIVIFREFTAKIAFLTDKSNQKGDSGGVITRIFVSRLNTFYKTLLSVLVTKSANHQVNLCQNTLYY